MPNTPLPLRRSTADAMRRAPSSDERESVAAILSERFAADALSLEEFEQRVATVYRATSRAELDALTADLVIAAPAVPRGEVATAPADSVPARGRRFAILSNLEHHSIAVVPRQLSVSAILGNVELDLRDATFGAGITEVDVRAVFGHIGITLPAGTQVEQHASAILGSFECPPSSRALTRRSGLVVRIGGSVLLGAVEIRFAEPAPPAGRTVRLDSPRRPS